MVQIIVFLKCITYVPWIGNINILLLHNGRINKMNLEQAITRINNIEWDKVGIKASKEDGILGAEFLHRLANFYNEKLIKPYPPLLSDIANILGDNSEMDFDQYYNDMTREFLNKTIYQNKIVEYYLKLSRLAEKNLEAKQFLNVYEPLIEIFEKGGSFKLRKNDLEIEQIIFIPLNNWFDKFNKNIK